jgi:ATP-dependent DNA helicase RecG
LISDPATPEASARIEAMVNTNDGFHLAEIDLALRGPGTVLGARQSGMPDLRLADLLQDTEELVAARHDAFAIVGQDPELDSHAGIRDEIVALLGHRVEWLLKS